MLEVFVLSYLYVWNQMPWRNLQTIVLPQVNIVLWGLFAAFGPEELVRVKNIC